MLRRTLRMFSGKKIRVPNPEQNSIPGFRAPGQVASNWELAAGAERFEYLKKLEGEDPWEDLNPIILTEPGTVKSPIIVKGVDSERYIGCTGFPADSHEVVWLTLRPREKGVDRCPHCGNAFKVFYFYVTLVYSGK